MSTNAMRIVAIAVLGRALTQDDFGIVAVAISVNAILFAIRDIGVGQALVQRKQLSPEHLTTAFALSLYLGVALSVALLFAAPLIGDLYGIPASVEVVRALGLLFVLRGVSATSRFVCQRELRFRTIAIIDALAFALGSITSVVLAVGGMGPWALVIGYLVEEGIATALYLWASPPRWSLALHRARLRELMSFGAGQTVGQIAGIVATYGDNFVVGKVRGSGALGNYTRAYELIKFPSTVFAVIVGNVLFPAFSRLQDEREQLATSFRRVTFINALVLLPASAALIVLAPEMIRVLVGRGWDDAVIPFQILAATMLLRTSQKLGAIVAQAAGAVNAVAIAYVVYMIAVVGGAALSIRWGIAGVATTTSIAIAIVSVECMYLAMKVSRLPLSQLIGAHLPGLVLAGMTAAIAWPFAHLLRGASVPAGAVLAAVGGLSVATCAVVVLVLARRRSGDFAWLNQELTRLRRRGRSVAP